MLNRIDKRIFLSGRILYFVISILLSFTSFGHIFNYREYSLNYRIEYFFKKPRNKKKGFSYTQYIENITNQETIIKLKSSYNFLIRKIEKIFINIIDNQHITFYSIKCKFLFFIKKPQFANYYFSF